MYLSNLSQYPKDYIPNGPSESIRIRNFAEEKFQNIKHSKINRYILQYYL